MSDATPVRRRIGKWARRIALIPTGLIAFLVFALTLGAFVPAIPYLGVFGSVALSIFPAWIVLASVIGAAAAGLLGRGRVRLIMLSLAGVAALGSVIVTARLLLLASANGVRLTTGASFGSGGLLGKPAPPDETQTYLRDLGDTLTIHIWQPHRPAPGQGWPVLVYVHGGGWTTGTALPRGNDMRWFADHGWLVVGVEYSLSNAKRHLWDRVHAQIGCALSWTRANIAARRGDATRLALFGESAGGNLVLNVASMANGGRLPSACGGTIPHVAAVTAIYPAADIRAVWNNNYIPTGPGVREMAEQYTGGTPASVPDRYAATASATYLNAGTPPTLLFITGNDHLVPLYSMRAYDTAARKAGVNVQTITVPYAEHGFDAAGIGNAIVREATLRFLAMHVPPKAG